MVFNADHRNIGGRDQIIGRLQNHRKKMKKIKPTMNTRIKPKKTIMYMKTVNSNKNGKLKLNFKSLKHILLLCLLSVTYDLLIYKSSPLLI